MPSTYCMRSWRAISLRLLSFLLENGTKPYSWPKSTHTQQRSEWAPSGFVRGEAVGRQRQLVTEHARSEVKNVSLDSHWQTTSGPLWRACHLLLFISFRTYFINYPWYGMVWYGMVWYGMVWYGFNVLRRIKQIYMSVGLTSHSTHYRSSRGWFYGSVDPTNGVTALKDNG